MKIKTSDSFNIGTITFSQFERACSGFDLESALRFIQLKSVEMNGQIGKTVDVRNSNLGSGNVYVTPETHAFVSKHLILNSSLLFNRTFRNMNYEELVIYSNHLETDLDHSDPQNPDAQLWLVRASYIQGRYQRIPAHILGRYYILFNELGQNSETLSRMVEIATGLSVDEIMRIGLSFYASILENDFLNIEKIKTHRIPKLNNALQPGKLTKFLESVSKSQDEFRGECRRWDGDNVVLKKYEFNPLGLYPIIDTGLLSPENRYLVPSLNDLIYRFTEGIYYSALDYYRRGAKKNDFSNKFGALFEEYVGLFLKDVKTKNKSLNTIQPETEYMLRNNKVRSADWLLIGVDNVIQIECKKITTSNKFRAAVSDGSQSDWDAMLDRFAGYVTKLYEKATHIKNGLLNLPAKKVNSVFSVFVVLDDFPFIDSRFKKEITNRAAREIPAVAKDFRYHILGCGDFEVLCEFLKTHPEIDFVELIKSKEESQNYSKGFNDFLEKDFNFSYSSIELISDAYDKFRASIL